MRLIPLLAIAACYRSPPPAVTPIATQPAPPSPCVIVAVVHRDVQTIDRPQTIYTPGGDTIHAGEGDRIINGPGRLAVLDLDVATGATRPRANIRTDGRPLHLFAAAAHEHEITLHLLDLENEGGLVTARIDLRARRIELGPRYPFEVMRSSGVLASDGESYFKPCGGDDWSLPDRICRADDWEVRGNPIELASTDRFFDAIAAGSGELFAIHDGAVHVFDLETGTAARTFPIAVDKLQGVGLVGDDLVVASDRRLARYDRISGEPRGSAPIVGLDTATELRLTCR